jgi:PAT family beta-lactamase induction signal transducer AmpG
MATTIEAERGWRAILPAGVRPYTEAAPIAALFLGISSGFPYAMIGATLTTRLKQDGIDKSTITAFTLVFLAYNFKFLWAWIMDGVRLPILGRLGQRVSWMLVTGAAVIAAVVNLALVDPAQGISTVVTAAILVGVAGASFDIVIDAYRIELGHVAIRLEDRFGWSRSARPRCRGEGRLAGRLSRLCGLGLPCDAYGTGHGRAQAPP